MVHLLSLHGYPGHKPERRVEVAKLVVLLDRIPSVHHTPTSRQQRRQFLIPICLLQLYPLGSLVSTHRN